MEYMGIPHAHHTQGSPEQGVEDAGALNALGRQKGLTVDGIFGGRTAERSAVKDPQQHPVAEEQIYQHREAPRFGLVRKLRLLMDKLALM